MKTKFLTALSLVVVLLASISAVAPSLAEPQQKISATATLRFPTVTGAERTLDTNGGIRHFWGVQKTFSVDLSLAEQLGGQTEFTGKIRLVIDFTTNFKTGETVYHSTTCVWTFDGGSFAGVMQARQSVGPGGSSGTYEESLVLQGAGIFNGCTLKLSRTNNQPYTGFLLKSASAN